MSKRDWTGSTLGERITHVCELRGWTLLKLSREAGIASGPMSRLSHHPAPIGAAPATLMRIADAANVSVLWLTLARGPVETVPARPGMLRTHPDWRKALAMAKKRQRGIPEEFWLMVGDAVLNVRKLDWQLVVGLVRELYSAHQREFETEDEAMDLPRDRPTVRTPDRSGGPNQLDRH